MSSELEAFLARVAKHRDTPETSTGRLVVQNLKLRGEKLSALDPKPDLNGIDFYNCDLSFADLSDLHLEDTSWTNCRLGSAQLIQAQLHGARFLEGCDLEGASLRDAVATSAEFFRLRGRELCTVDARGAKFYAVRFNQTRLSGADFSQASLIGAHGYILDSTRIHLTEFSAVASDPWSILRRTYTGPRFTLNLLLLIVFLISVLAKTFAFQVFAVLQSVHAIGAPLKAFCASHPCTQVRLVDVLLANGRGPVAQTFVYTALVYNVLRLILTFTVAGLREQEERSSRSPAFAPASAFLLKRRIWELVTSPRQFYGWMIPFHWLICALWLIMVASFSLEAWKLAHEVLLLPI